MSSDILSYLSEFFKSNTIKATNHNLNKIIQRYIFLIILDEFDFNQNQIIYQNLKESKFVIINKYKNNDLEYIIIGFKQTIIIIDQKSLSILQSFFFTNPYSSFFFLGDTKDIFNQYIKMQNEQTANDDVFIEEIKSFDEKLIICKISEISHVFERIIRQILIYVTSCITGYLIKSSYDKLKIVKKIDFSLNSDSNNLITKFKRSDFIVLRTIGSGTYFVVKLIYYIERNELLALKMNYRNDPEIEKLLNREITNNSMINYPFIPKFYGIVQDKYYIITDYINGKTLLNIKNLNLDDKDKFLIIFEIMMSINYLHNNKFIYRDMKPNNVIIDENKTAFLIDFDRMIQSDYLVYEGFHTADFLSVFVDPKVNEGNISYKNDIYSLGQMIYYIMYENYPKQTQISKDEIKDAKIKNIYQKCIDDDVQRRPTIFELMFEFYDTFRSQINFLKIKNDLFVQFIHDLSCNKEYPSQIDYKTIIESYNISENQNHLDTLYLIGFCYLNGVSVKLNIHKSIPYFALAAKQYHYGAQQVLSYINSNYNVYTCEECFDEDMDTFLEDLLYRADQNDPIAQYDLGVIYSTDRYGVKNINKALYYYSLAAKQNFVKAQSNLGSIYLEGKYVNRDINKSIYYLTLAANQHYPQALFNLGSIYYQGQYVTQNINIAINYFVLAANKNFPQAQFNMGMIYLEGKHIKKDINMAIHYFELASNQNIPQAQHVLGNIYYNGIHIERDINKAIHYLTMASNNNIPEAQHSLGNLFLEGVYIERDINKAIHFLTLASSNNILEAQYNLGVLYFEGIYVEKDLDRGIYYLTLAANKNLAQAQCYLGAIYLEGRYKMKDIPKSIYFFTLAAANNSIVAQYALGRIYYDGVYVKRDINKAIHYFTSAANRNNLESQCILGIIYYENRYIRRDIYKAVHYLTSAADKNNVIAQFYLSRIYFEGKYINKNINKAIHYMTLSADQGFSLSQVALSSFYFDKKYGMEDINKALYYLNLAAYKNSAEAQYILGCLYLEGKYVENDIQKAFHYFTLSANQNFSLAQLNLGILYLNDLFIHKNIKKGLYYLLLSSKYGNKVADFSLGSLYHEGKHVDRDIKKSIHHYREASSFNDSYAKNNLGVIYKIGLDEIPQNIGKAISYFDEAIKQKNDRIAMFNLSAIYIYDDKTNDRIDLAINLLLKAIKYGFKIAEGLLYIALMKKYEFNYEKVKKELENCSYELSDTFLKYYFENYFETLYRNYKTFYYVYDFTRKEVLSIDFVPKAKENSNQKIKSITSLFYEGFGINT